MIAKKVLMVTLSLVLLSAFGCDEPDDPREETEEGLDYDPREDRGEEGVRPENVDSVFDENALFRLQASGVDLFWGDDPPEVSGRFRIENASISFDDQFWDLVGRTVVDSTMTLTVVDGGYEILREDDDGVTTIGEAGFISGHGECFTIYVETIMARGECDIFQAEVYSGCYVEGDLYHFQNASIPRELMSETCVEEENRRIDSLRIIRDPGPIRGVEL